MARGRARADGTTVKRGPNYGTPMKAIRQHCLSCVDDSAHEVKLCPCVDCKLYPWRFGMGPDFAREKGYVVDPPKGGNK